MAVLLEGLNIPEGNPITINIYRDGTWVNAYTTEDGNAIEVPEPHGRLIDADALHKLFEDQWDYLQVLDWNENPTAEAKQSGINWCINTMHDDATTVVPASEEVE